MSKYDELDAAIIARVAGGFSRFYEIWPAVKNLAYPHRTVPNGGSDRVVDRRLQALRKQGKLMCHGVKWRIDDRNAPPASTKEPKP